ncbi:MAG: relaxase/mobilization nuclease domain-containing protein, partial [Tannerellaceae bacterium]|nr:relaxase/mobilization nuclease domain-containing protein [Tannerellaceae bacterium]
GTSLYGAIAYNMEKVMGGTAHIITGNRMVCDVQGKPVASMQQTLLAFENHLLSNRNTEKPILHISLNPSPDDRLTDGEFAALAREYMKEMGYGNQPYIVYRHEDTGRPHIHIVSVAVDENGVKIPDSYEWRRSMNACRKIETMFGLQQLSGKQEEAETFRPEKVDYAAGELKKQLAGVLKSVATTYSFRSMGEYNALLSLFNIEAKTVNGQFNGKPYNGLLYSVTDGKGEACGTPFKASLWGKAFGYEAVVKRMKHSAESLKKNGMEGELKKAVLLALRRAGSREDFSVQLKRADIEAVFRENKDRRIYGVTFVDHKRKLVCNGSRLGKECSANVFNRLFNEPAAEPRLDKEADRGMRGKDSLASPGDFFPSSFSQETLVEQASGLFDFEQHGPDYEEEAFARRMKRRKKKRRPNL